MKKVIFIIIGLIALAYAFLSGNFFPKQENTIPIPIQTDAPIVQCYFTQNNDYPDKALINLYNASTKTLDVAIYSLTYPSIVKALGDAHKRGIVVRIITDEQQASGSSQKHAINDLLLVGVPMKIKSNSGLMHLKMSIIDNKIVTTGSYNYSANASTDNDEMLVILNDVNMLNKCSVEFNKLWNNPLYIPAKMSY